MAYLGAPRHTHWGAIHMNTHTPAGILRGRPSCWTTEHVTSRDTSEGGRDSSRALQETSERDKNRVHKKSQCLAPVSKPALRVQSCTAGSAMEPAALLQLISPKLWHYSWTKGEKHSLHQNSTWSPWPWATQVTASLSTTCSVPTAWSPAGAGQCGEDGELHAAHSTQMKEHWQDASVSHPCLGFLIYNIKAIIMPYQLRT